MASWDHKASPHGNPQQAAAPRPTPQGPRPPLLGNGKHALADAIDICAAELDMLIDRHFTAHRTLVVEQEGSKWTAAIGDTVLYRSPDRAATLRFAETFASRTPGVVLEVVHEFSMRVDNVVAIR